MCDLDCSAVIMVTDELEFDSVESFVENVVDRSIWRRFIRVCLKAQQVEGCV